MLVAMLKEAKFGQFSELSCESKTSKFVQGEKILVKEIGKGGFFGEVALVTKASTRVADCIAKTR